MKNTATKPQNDREREEAGSEFVQRLVSKGSENVGGLGDAGRSELEEKLEPGEGKRKVFLLHVCVPIIAKRRKSDLTDTTTSSLKAAAGTGLNSTKEQRSKPQH